MIKSIEALINDLKAAAHEENTLRESGDTSEKWQDEASPENVLLLIDALEFSRSQYEIAGLLRDKVKRLEIDLWDSKQLISAKSESQNELRQEISELKEKNRKESAWFIERLEELEASKEGDKP
ncbi:TPA: hypothetical protein ACPZHP_001366 [Yersinia enterocolitica]|nr:hypothetical protein [Yersinia enterocolitica]HEI6794432.1 hypothetical protein [Yersinia enterocolitica]HEN3429724.1 hypothetical protein [Yersinia enterocolitica]